jgi:hypothetical protein
METVSEVDSQNSVDDSSLVKETGKSQSSEKPAVKEKRSFHLMIKWSVVLAFITTYTHFFGFSFVKGKLQAAGFYSSDISLDVNETLHEAAAATYKGLDSIAKSFFSYETFQTAIFLAVMLPSVFLFVIGLRYLEKTSRIEKASNVVQSVKAKIKNKYVKVVKNTLVTTMLAAVGLMLPYLSVMLIVTVISIAWLGMSLGQNLGEAYTKDLIEKKVCKPLSEAKADIVRSCMAIQLADGSVLSGRILHQDQSQLFFLTNNGSYLINENLEVHYSACIHRVKEAMGSPSEIVTGCMARCEPSCQKESKEVSSPAL